MSYLAQAALDLLLAGAYYVGDPLELGGVVVLAEADQVRQP